MHIHSHPTNFNSVDLYSSKAAEKAASAQRAADVRRKLIKRGMEIEDEVNSFEGLMIGRSAEGGSRQHRGQDKKQDHADSAQRLQHVDDGPADEPLSFWA